MLKRTQLITAYLKLNLFFLVLFRHQFFALHMEDSCHIFSYREIIIESFCKCFQDCLSNFLGRLYN